MVIKNDDFIWKFKKNRIFVFKSDFLNLNQIMTYIRIFHFLIGYNNYHNYVKNLAESVI